MDRSLIAAAKFLFGAAAAACAIGMVGPFQGVEQALVPWDKAAHFIAFYGLNSLLFLAFPTRRRVDLTVLAIFMGCMVEVAQRMTGRDAELGDIFADALGALAVLAPLYIETVRARSRGEAQPERRQGALALGEPPRVSRAAQGLVKS
ncbi:VanZ family protein [Phenylobacterium sp.]|uniref:VanZ family protein n=1 Tax=Phenylobacterium sp. TaxID=1871053 RepID=UPI002733B495|nr:VanZ family protein [Phenylobacterium sp.]MDP3658474.1 VanZ family protein [Phenylobacterium sp.]